MKKGIIILLLLPICVFAQIRGLKRNGLLMVDLGSGLTDEYRISYETRIAERAYFWVFKPGFILRDDLRKFNHRAYGASFRVGLKKYLESDNPAGWFFMPALCLRVCEVTYYNDTTLAKLDSQVLTGLGGHFSVGRNWFVDPRRNITVGASAGVEYYFDYVWGDSTRFSVRDKWYQLPISNKPPILKGVQFFIGLEIGVALRQKKRHL